jgi:hypothetical protein
MGSAASLCDASNRHHTESADMKVLKWVAIVVGMALKLIGNGAARDRFAQHSPQAVTRCAMPLQHLTRAALCGLLALSSTACERSTGLEERVKAVELDLAVTQMKLSAVEASVVDTPAIVRTDGDHFSVARHSLGAATVSVQSVEPYLEGFKVVFQLGNLTTADLEDVKVKVQWGKPGWFEQASKEAPVGQLKEKTLTGATLRAGAYSSVEVVIAPAAPDEVRQLSVSLDPGAVSLRALPRPR